MRLFDGEIAPTLESEILGELIQDVVLGSCGIVFTIGSVRVSCSEAVFAEIGGASLTYEEAPFRGEWGLLVRQVVNEVSLKSPTELRFGLRSGDTITVTTSESPYESVVIEFPGQGDARVMEIY